MFSFYCFSSILYVIWILTKSVNATVRLIILRRPKVLLPVCKLDTSGGHVNQAWFDHLLMQLMNLS